MTKKALMTKLCGKLSKHGTEGQVNRMIEISIHVPSLCIGFFIGYGVIAAIFLWLMYGDQYDNGFKKGWDAGIGYWQKETKDEQRKA